MNPEAVSLVAYAERYFRSTRFSNIVNEALSAYARGDEDGVRVAVDRLPTWESLLKELMDKLEGKSVLKSVKRVAERSTENKWVKVKALCSLATHAAIECERGNFEYRLVLEKLYEQLGTLVFAN